MSAVMKKLLGRGDSVEQTTLDSELQDAKQKAADITQRMQECDTETLTPLAQERARLAALSDQLTDLRADALITGKALAAGDTRELEAQIAACGTRVSQLAARAPTVMAAQAKLRRQLLEHQQRIRVLSEQLPRQHLAQLDQRLTEVAGQYRTAIEQLNGALVEVAAIAAAYDTVGPNVGGFTGVASRGMASLDLPAPAHPAYKDLGGLQKLQARVDVRKAQILRELQQS